MFWSLCAECVEFLSQRRSWAVLMESRHGEGQTDMHGLYQRNRSDLLFPPHSVSACIVPHSTNHTQMQNPYSECVLDQLESRWNKVWRLQLTWHNVGKFLSWPAAIEFQTNSPMKARKIQILLLDGKQGKSLMNLFLSKQVAANSATRASQLKHTSCKWVNWHTRTHLIIIHIGRREKGVVNFRL